MLESWARNVTEYYHFFEGNGGYSVPFSWVYVSSHHLLGDWNIRPLLNGLVRSFWVFYSVIGRDHICTAHQHEVLIERVKDRYFDHKCLPPLQPYDITIFIFGSSATLCAPRKYYSTPWATPEHTAAKLH